MGVKGLSSFLSAEGRSLKRHHLHDCDLVIDATNLLYALYFGYDISWLFGGEYAQFHARFSRFIDNLLACQIRPFFLLDGCSNPDNLKIRTIISRFKNKIATLASLNKPNAQAAANNRSNTILPMLTGQVMFDVLRNHNDHRVRYFVCNDESDVEIASLATELDCPILSNDSDFFIFPLPPRSGVIGFDSLGEPEVFSPSSATSDCQTWRIACRIFRQRQFRFSDASHFRLRPRLMPLFATLVGNDLIESAAFSKIYAQLKRVRWARNLTPKSERIVALLLWIHSFAAACLTSSLPPPHVDDKTGVLVGDDLTNQEQISHHEEEQNKQVEDNEIEEEGENKEETIEAPHLEKIIVDRILQFYPAGERDSLRSRIQISLDQYRIDSQMAFNHFFPHQSTSSRKIDSPSSALSSGLSESSSPLASPSFATSSSPVVGWPQPISALYRAGLIHPMFPNLLVTGQSFLSVAVEFSRFPSVHCHFTELRHFIYSLLLPGDTKLTHRHKVFCEYFRAASSGDGFARQPVQLLQQAPITNNNKKIAPQPLRKFFIQEILKHECVSSCDQSNAGSGSGSGVAAAWQPTRELVFIRAMFKLVTSGGGSTNNKTSNTQTPPYSFDTATLVSALLSVLYMFTQQQPQQQQKSDIAQPQQQQSDIAQPQQQQLQSDKQVRELSSLPAYFFKNKAYEFDWPPLPIHVFNQIQSAYLHLNNALLLVQSQRFLEQPQKCEGGQGDNNSIPSGASPLADYWLPPRPNQLFSGAVFMSILRQKPLLIGSRDATAPLISLTEALPESLRRPFFFVANQIAALLDTHMFTARFRLYSARAANRQAVKNNTKRARKNQIISSFEDEKEKEKEEDESEQESTQSSINDEALDDVIDAELSDACLAGNRFGQLRIY